MTGSKIKRTAGKTVILALAASFAATAALPVGTASAGDRHWHGPSSDYHRYEKHRKYRYDRKGRRYVRNSNGEWVLAGIIGLALGAMLADQANRDREERVYIYEDRDPPRRARSSYDEKFSDDYDYDSYGSVERRPLNTVPAPSRTGRTYRNDDAPRVIRYEDELALTYEPWTPEWRDWCDAKYRSFKASTGTYRGYDGKDHFCVVK